MPGKRPHGRPAGVPSPSTAKAPTTCPLRFLSQTRLRAHPNIRSIFLRIPDKRRSSAVRVYSGTCVGKSIRTVSCRPKWKKNWSPTSSLWTGKNRYRHGIRILIRIYASSTDMQLTPAHPNVWKTGATPREVICTPCTAENGEATNTASKAKTPRANWYWKADFRTTARWVCTTPTAW